MELQTPSVEHKTALARLLYERRITGADLARGLAVSESAVSRWCSGQRSLSSAMTTRIANLLGVSPDEIIGS